MTGNYFNDSGTVSDVINKAHATISVVPYNVTYDGTSHNATGTATGAGGVDLSYLLNVGPGHTNANIYSDNWTFAGTGNYYVTPEACSTSLQRRTQ